MRGRSSYGGEFSSCAGTVPNGQPSNTAATGKHTLTAGGRRRQDSRRHRYLPGPIAAEAAIWPAAGQAPANGRRISAGRRETASLTPGTAPLAHSAPGEARHSMAAAISPGLVTRLNGLYT